MDKYNITNFNAQNKRSPTLGIDNFTDLPDGSRASLKIWFSTYTILVWSYDLKIKYLLNDQHEVFFGSQSMHQHIILIVKLVWR